MHLRFYYDRLSDLLAKRTADLEHFSDHYFGRNIARYTVLRGGRGEKIQHFATREKIDLIMLPRNHQNLLDRMLHESLTATLLDRCTASVWTTEYTGDARPSSVNSILCAVHFGRDVRRASANHGSSRK